MKESKKGNSYFTFDDDRAKFVITAYANEIMTRNKWVQQAIQSIDNEFIKSQQSTSYRISVEQVFRNSMDLVSNALMIHRLINGANPARFEKERVQARVDFIKKWFPEMPTEAPESLIDIRNDYEHFESRLDEWANSEYVSSFIDMNIGGSMIHIPGSIHLRGFEDFKLTFWDRKVDLLTVAEWCNSIEKEVEKNRHKFD